MGYIQEIATGKADFAAVKKVLDESLNEDDFFCNKSRNQLSGMGVKAEEALKLLARHKSSVKYGYDLSSNTLSHLLELAETSKKNPR